MHRLQTFIAVAGLLAVVSVRGALAQARSEVADGTGKFEVASVRIMEDRDRLPMAQQMFSMSPSGAAQFSMRNANLDLLIGWAFKVGGFVQPIVGKPAWADSTYYEVAAKPEGDEGLNYDQLRPLLQELLKDRFHLAYHMEKRDAKGYALVIAKGGPKLAETKSVASHAYMMNGKLDAADVPMSTVAELLGHAAGETVVDETGLKGNYDLNNTRRWMRRTLICHRYLRRLKNSWDSS